MKQKPAKVEVYLSLGSNLGDREQNLARAMDLLAQRVKIEQTSSLYVTEPVDHKDQPLFLNAVCRVRTSLAPEELLGLAKRIEVAMGRKPSFVNGPRPIDIDILFYGDKVVNIPQFGDPASTRAGAGFCAGASGGDRPEAGASGERPDGC